MFLKEKQDFLVKIPFFQAPEHFVYLIPVSESYFT